ncbi:MAG: hypothetical protein IKQ00_09255 [Butyrivibrio sp.]|uniref:Uncharacterized protein n=1 Tax=Butyrivibrio hungatei TaxID=185008 RepID=A0A1G5CHV1_9FIRM|nr:DUF6465 family protein [Butyrivibrio hungatei]MBR4358100.1 hypothetical protein [Butyrivibrio sp.]MBR4639877.1 hypothetical protein [Butyrivibrio sp.]SCY01983.1 hypothetical protein SAMN02910451_01136 [Butyrivibrio hungatei]
MAEIKKAEAVVKPVATIKNPTFITEVKTPEVKDTTAETKKAPAKKATAKKATTKKTTAKKTTTKKAASTAKKTTATKTAAKKTTAKKTAAKTTAKKTTTRKAATKPNVMIEIQYSYKHISNDELVQKSLDNYQYDLKGDPTKVKKLSIYVKPQEDKAYYVVDDKISGDIDI